mgnify:FL=1
MIKIFTKKFLHTFFTPKYNYQFHKKVYKIKNRLIKKVLNSFWFFPNSLEFYYWKYSAEKVGHGFKKFIKMDYLSILLEKTLIKYAKKDDKILDICCNVGRVLSKLKSKKYTNLNGFDINDLAIKNSKKIFNNLKNANMKSSSAESFLESAKNNSYDVTYTLGASIELLPPTFDVVKNIHRITKKYFICLINAEGHRYPRFWEYEFKKCGFKILEKINLKKHTRVLFVLKK